MLEVAINAAYKLNG